MAKNITSKTSEEPVIGTPLQKKPWKVWMSIAPQPSAVLISLYDLLFNDKNELYYKGTTPSDPKSLKLKGLQHNIFIYDTALYQNDGQLIGTAPIEAFYEEGLDLGIPKYDIRAKKRIVTTTIDDQKVQFALPDRDSALYYPTAETLYESDGRSIGTQTTCAVLSEYTAAPLSTTNAPGLSFILSSPDTVFDSTLVLEPTKKSFTQVCLNLYINTFSLPGNTRNTWDIINNTLKSLALDVETGWEPFSNSGQSSDEKRRNDLLDWVSKGEGKDILQHSYVWLKAPFAADYIDPKDFNQDLNQEASVIHKNLYSSAFNSDYNRYDEYSGTLDSSEVPTAATTRGYIPKNAPLKDLVSHKLFANEVEGFDDLPLAKKISKLEEASSLDMTNIGGVLSEPVKNLESISLGNSVVPPQFFDSETRYASDEERTKLGRVPAGLPKYGNIYSDGRILSPTIDELWYMVKKLISGRRPDNLSTTINEEDFGELKGTGKRENIADTTISEVTTPFNFDSAEGTPVEGDPVNFKITLGDGDIESLQVTEYFTQPNEAIYHNFDDLVDLNTYYQTHGTENGKVIKEGEVAEGQTPTFSNIQLEGIEDYKGTSQKWKVRSEALSLRELEGRTLSLKFNLEKTYKDIVKNFVAVGPLGLVYKYVDEAHPEGEISAAGGLYQLHRDFNFDAKSPNTWFHMNGDHTGDKETGGYDATFGDLEAEGITEEDNLKLYGVETKKTSKKPLLKENYGKSQTLSNDDAEYYGSDIYLAADGTWRYRSEHVRVPILRSRY